MGIRRSPVRHSRFAICASLPHAPVRHMTEARAHSPTGLGLHDDECAVIWRTGAYGKPTLANWHRAKQHHIISLYISCDYIHKFCVLYNKKANSVTYSLRMHNLVLPRPLHRKVIHNCFLLNLTYVSPVWKLVSLGGLTPLYLRSFDNVVLISLRAFLTRSCVPDPISGPSHLWGSLMMQSCCMGFVKTPLISSSQYA